MTPTLEEVKKVCEQCGMFPPSNFAALQAFARHYKEAGRKEQREVDLKLCRAQSDKYWKFKGTKDWSGYVEGMSDGADECEEVGDEYTKREGRKYPELRSDATTGAYSCMAAARTKADNLRAANKGKE